MPDERVENLLTASRLLAALTRSKQGARALVSQLADVFPWTGYLQAGERDDFARELAAALPDPAEPAIRHTLLEVIAGWRATARIKAGPGRHAQGQEVTEGDFGPAQAPG